MKKRINLFEKDSLFIKKQIMYQNSLDSSSEYLDYYASKGYVDNFKISDEGLIHLKSKRVLKSENIYIVAQHRFEGKSNPSDMAVLYVIEAKDGIKGTVLVNYNPSSATELAEFFNTIPKENIKQNTEGITPIE